MNNWKINSVTIYWFHVGNIHRSSHQRCSMQKGVVRNFTKFTGKHLCQVLFLIKLKAWGLQLYWNRDPGTGVFLWISWNFQEHLFYRTPLVAASLSRYRKWPIKHPGCLFKNKYGVKSVQIRSIFGLNTGKNSDWIQENMEQKKLRIWTLFTQWNGVSTCLE